jgi:hypothetical protein
MRVGHFLRQYLKSSGCSLRHFREHFPLRENLSVATTIRCPYRIRQSVVEPPPRLKLFKVDAHRHFP